MTETERWHTPILVLVTGATGKQGGAVARRLLAAGHRVRALTRKPDAPAVFALERLGAEIVLGSMDERLAVEAAAQGTDAVFAVTTPFEAGMEAEVRQGVTVAEAAKAMEVEHLVYSSVACANCNTGIPHFESKYRVERHIAALGIPYTILAPAFFMENLLSPALLSGLRQGRLAMALPAGRLLQQIALADLANLALMAIESRVPFLHARIDIASDALNGTQMAGVLSRIAGRKIEYAEVPLEQVRAHSDDTARMFEWFNRVGYSADIAELRRRYPQVGWHTFEAWAKEQNLAGLLGP